MSLIFVSPSFFSARARPWPAVLLIVTAGCFATPLPIGSDTDGDASESDGSASASESSSATHTTTTTTSESSPEDTGPVAAHCGAALTRDACTAADANAPEGIGCSWQTVSTILVEDGGWAPCTQGRLTEECVTTEYQGDGCVILPACGVDETRTVYYREADFGVQFLAEASFCDHQPIDWSMCGWDPDGNPTEGARECACFCDSRALLPPDVEETLTVRGGCGDLDLFAHNDDDTIGLAFVVRSGFVETVTQSDKVFELDLTLDVTADPLDTFELRMGRVVSERICNDALTDQHVIEHAWRATSGTATIHLEERDEADPFVFATVTITDVEFTTNEPGVQNVRIDHFEWVDVLVGQLPG